MRGWMLVSIFLDVAFQGSDLGNQPRGLVSCHGVWIPVIGNLSNLLTIWISPAITGLCGTQWLRGDGSCT